jgi:hypothetical protein
MEIELWLIGMKKLFNMEKKQPQSFSEWLNSSQTQKMMHRVGKQYDESVKKLSELLTDEMVSDIKKWRIGDGPDDLTTHSWRSLACEFHDKYEAFSNENSIDYGNQISGMQLCEAAMIKLNEKAEDGWN